MLPQNLGSLELSSCTAHVWIRITLPSNPAPWDLWSLSYSVIVTKYLLSFLLHCKKAQKEKTKKHIHRGEGGWRLSGWMSGMKKGKGEIVCTLKKAASGPFFSYTLLVLPMAIIIPCMLGVIIACPGSRNHVKHNNRSLWQTEQGRPLCYALWGATMKHTTVRAC